MKKSAFTLIELLVVVAIIAVLASLATVVAGKVTESGYLARETSAGRNLMTAYLSYASDNNGQLMPGYTTAPGTVNDDKGQTVQFPASGRYPWRLAQYLKGPAKGTLIVNQQAKLTETRDHSFYVYLTSLMPTFGINANFVGGNESGALAPTQANFGRLGGFCVTNLGQAVRASQQVVFCSARYQVKSGEGAYGYHLVEPPYTNARRWSKSYKKDASPQASGYVHFRYDDKAVVVMLDGHVEMLTFEQLEDMRRWCNLAAEADNPNYFLGQQ